MTEEKAKRRISPVFRGHAIAPEVRKYWDSLSGEVNATLEALRDKLRGDTGALPVYHEQLLISFANAALTERILHAQFAYWMQHTQDLQAKGEDSSLPLNNALKVMTTVKGPAYQKLLCLREIDAMRKKEEAKVPSLQEYIAETERKTCATMSRKRSGPEPTIGKGTGRTERARFPDTEKTSDSSR